MPSIPSRRIVTAWPGTEAGVVETILYVLLALAMGLGTLIGVHVFGLANQTEPALYVDVPRFVPALACVVALGFAVSGTTMIVSAFGRSRGRALGYGALLVLVQFLVNVIGQLWTPLASLRTLTIFYHYQPQPMIVNPGGATSGAAWLQVGILMAVGAGGYAIAAWKFCRRDLPAPL